MASWPKRCAKLASKQAMHIHTSLLFLTPHTSLLSLYNQQLAAYTPSPGNGDRVFYETLLEQNPASEMAQKWCVHHGVLGNQSPSLHFTLLPQLGNSHQLQTDWDRAQELYAKICKREGKAFSPVKRPPGAGISNGDVVKKPAVSKKSIYDDGDDIVGHSAGTSNVWEGQGTIGI